MIQVCIDLGLHRLANLPHPLPETDRAVFAALAAEGLVDAELGTRLEKMARFRNVLDQVPGGDVEAETASPRSSTDQGGGIRQGWRVAVCGKKVAVLGKRAARVGELDANCHCSPTQRARATPRARAKSSLESMELSKTDAALVLLEPAGARSGFSRREPIAQPLKECAP